MAHWAVIIPADRYATERLYSHDTLDLPGVDLTPAVPGDQVLLVADGAPRSVVGLGRVQGAGVLAYTRRSFEEPVAADRLALAGPLTPVDADVYARHAAQLGCAAGRRSWLVSVDLPIEAQSPAEAVRQFWSYVSELGPGELPTYVSPSDDELAMQAFVLGEVANQDPEDD
ncbi:MAG TPA: hypothetical protein VFO77_14990 [Actinoplanes sp.]|nr:hypothetical protein [Actinoplanes sp.]